MSNRKVITEEILAFIEELKKGYQEDIKLDCKLSIDPYDNVARYKVCERIEKFIRKRGEE